MSNILVSIFVLMFLWYIFGGLLNILAEHPFFTIFTAALAVKYGFGLNFTIILGGTGKLVAVIFGIILVAAICQGISETMKEMEDEKAAKAQVASEAQEAKERAQAEARKQAEEERRQAEARKQAEEERRQAEARKQAREKRRQAEARKRAMAPFEEARSLFQVEMPYTMADIKKSRNNLVKKYHPDVPGGSDEMCKKVNAAYNLLARFAS